MQPRASVLANLIVKLKISHQFFDMLTFAYFRAYACKT